MSQSNEGRTTKDDMRILVHQVIDGQPTKPMEVSVTQLTQGEGILLRAILMANGLNAVVIKPKEVGTGTDFGK